MSLPTRAAMIAWSNQSEAKQGQGDIIDHIVGVQGGKPKLVLTISGGTVTASSTRSGDSGPSATPFVTIDTEGAAGADDLANIDVTEFDDGQFILVGLENAARIVTLKESAGGAGQMALRGSVDLVFSSVQQFVLFYVNKSGTAILEEVARYGFDTSTNEVSDPGSTTLTAADSGKTLTNGSGAANFVMPTPVDGLFYRFVVAIAAALNVEDAGSETFNIAASTSVSGFTNSTKGSVVEFHAIDGEWFATTVLGTWSAI